MSETSIRSRAIDPSGTPAPFSRPAPHGAESTGLTRPGQVSACSYELDIAPGPAGPILVLHLAGEIDLLTLPVLEHALTTAIDRRPVDLVVDLAAVGFCCAHGMELLAATAAIARSGGTSYAVSALAPRLDRVATLLWSGQLPVRYRSAAAAVTAIRLDQTHRLT